MHLTHEQFIHAFSSDMQMHILIFGGHACESTWIKTVLLFFTSHWRVY